MFLLDYTPYVRSVIIPFGHLMQLLQKADITEEDFKKIEEIIPGLNTILETSDCSGDLMAAYHRLALEKTLANVVDKAVKNPSGVHSRIFDLCVKHISDVVFKIFNVLAMSEDQAHRQVDYLARHGVPIPYDFCNFEMYVVRSLWWLTVLRDDQRNMCYYEKPENRRDNAIKFLKMFIDRSSVITALHKEFKNSKIDFEICLEIAKDKKIERHPLLELSKYSLLKSLLEGSMNISTDILMINAALIQHLKSRIQEQESFIYNLCYILVTHTRCRSSYIWNVFTKGQEGFSFLHYIISPLLMNVDLVEIVESYSDEIKVKPLESLTVREAEVKSSIPLEPLKCEAVQLREMEESLRVKMIRM